MLEQLHNLTGNPTITIDGARSFVNATVETMGATAISHVTGRPGRISKMENAISVNKWAEMDDAAKGFCLLPDHEKIARQIGMYMWGVLSLVRDSFLLVRFKCQDGEFQVLLYWGPIVMETTVPNPNGSPGTWKWEREVYEDDTPLDADAGNLVRWVDEANLIAARLEEDWYENTNMDIPF